MSNFGDLINIDEYGEKREQFNAERGDISFYCKNCKKIVKTQRKNPKGYTFICKECKGEDTVIGTLEGLKSNYRIK